ncbi:FAD-binding oxidoreductase [Acinetobacter defluvii]|uniref:FAD-binding oxidoreductase n=1 Tax=Acinetobacter defluvii TaxID=1871111 RepID=UPI000B05D353|nr:FAD-binding oxidoreductase [Acinetobacter defluvii]
MQKHHKNTLWLSLLLLVLAVISIPALHLLKTKLNEHPKIEQMPSGYRDDVSQLNKTKVHKIVDVAEDPVAMQNQLKEILIYAKQHHLKVSISGAKHSMGGHTIYPDGIALNMLPYNHMNLDEQSSILSIGSGATWQQALQYLDGFGKSIAVMQSFSDFSIGGSLSVNGHGWQKSSPPISSSVKSFTLMKANGEIVNCSRTENPELFKLVIGGYGLFGIILDLQIKVVDNATLKFHSVAIDPQQYTENYQKLVSDKPQVQFAYGRLRISDKHFLEQATLNYFTKTDEKPMSLMQQQSKNAEVRRMYFVVQWEMNMVSAYAGIWRAV